MDCGDIENPFAIKNAAKAYIGFQNRVKCLRDISVFRELCGRTRIFVIRYAPCPPELLFLFNKI
jgi:hypothetical protein